MTTALAFESFARTQCEAVSCIIDHRCWKPEYLSIWYVLHWQIVVEVGLGGRLDATNVITPALSVISSIGWVNSTECECAMRNILMALFLFDIGLIIREC